MNRSVLLLSLLLVGCHDGPVDSTSTGGPTATPAPAVIAVTCAPPDLVVDARDMTAHFQVRTHDQFSGDIQILDGSGWRYVTAFTGWAHAGSWTMEWTPPAPLGFGAYQARVRSTCSDYGGWVPFRFGGTPFEAPAPDVPKSCDDPFPGACRQ
jgi:hypothetical protein